MQILIVQKYQCQCDVFALFFGIKHSHIEYMYTGNNILVEYIDNWTRSYGIVSESYTSIVNNYSEPIFKYEHLIPACSYDIDLSLLQILIVNLYLRKQFICWAKSNVARILEIIKVPVSMWCFCFIFRDKTPTYRVHVHWK